MTSHWKQRILPVIVGAAAVAALAALPTAAARPSSSSPPNFDIHAVGQVFFSFGDPTCPGGLRIFGSAAAFGTHIGPDSTFNTFECATPEQGTGLTDVDGTATVIASNGDQLVIHYHGTTATLVPVNGVAQLNDHLSFEIVSGTGRFADAAGHGDGGLDNQGLFATGAVYFSATPTIVTSELKGTISMHPH